MCDCQEMSLDIKTPRNVHLSAFYKRTFAYHSIKNRLPIIITKIIDSLARNEEKIAKSYGEKSKEAVKIVIGELSKFNYEIQTNKPLTNLSMDESTPYNEYLAQQNTEEGHTTYFNTIWLLAECYAYQRVKEIFSLTGILSDYDYFGEWKMESYVKFLPSINNIANYLITTEAHVTVEQQKERFKTFLKMNLWGNKCDLSLSLAKLTELDKPLDNDELQANILVDDSDNIWNVLTETTAKSSDIVDIVLDNAGYELFTDFCLADYLINQNLCKIVRFYVKVIPWFISDVMKHDFLWVIQELKNNSNESIKKLGKRWEEFHNRGIWQVVEHPFWTLPFEYKWMKTTNPDLYRTLSESKLIIFKGDLNYRKLFGEMNWDPTTPVTEALEGFHPSKLCSLRTVKAEIIVGLKDGLAEELDARDPKWMETGDYGLIQFCDKIVKI